MLLRFEVSNYRSILESVELSMIAVDKDRPSVRKFDSLREGVLTIGGIYGPNASGKSNVIDALAWLSTAVKSSLRTWEHFIPREPFKFDGGSERPSTFAVEMIVNNIRYAYRIELNDSEVLFEGLYSYPEQRRRMLFERNGLSIQFRRGLGHLAGTKELLTPTTLALPVAMRFADPHVSSFGRQLTGITPRSPRHRWSPRSAWLTSSGLASTAQLFEERPSMTPSLFEENVSIPSDSRESALALLRFADLGIQNVKFTDEQDEGVYASPRTRQESRRQLQLIHRTATQEVPFDFSEESAGTQEWFRLIGPTLNALKNGYVILIDEIDAGLHPGLSARLLDLFQNPETNPSGAQLIFTTHDVSLLKHLNRDEVWLTERNDVGSTSLTALAEYDSSTIRRSLNLEKAYLQGRFGAIPQLDQVILHRVLGAAMVTNDAATHS